MKWKIQWSALLCLLLFGCSHPVFIVERPVDDPYVVVVKLSDAGLVEQRVAQIELPYAVTGKSDMVVRDNRLYVGSYGRLHILEYGANGDPHLISSLPVVGHNVALALHPSEPVLYIANNKGLFVVDIRDAANPMLIKHLLFSIELWRIWGGGWSNRFSGTDVACESDKLVVTLQDIIPNPADTTIIFDVSKPLTPRAERTLNTPPNTSAVAMGFVDHQIFTAGDEMIEYRRFEPDPIQQERGSSWLHRPYSQRAVVPGDVVEMKFVVKPFGYMERDSEKITFPLAAWGQSRDYEISLEKLREIIEDYRNGDSDERQQILDWAPLQHGIVYMATEHALTFYDTETKVLFWQLKKSVTYSEADRSKYNVSDYFSHVYGMDTRGHKQAYLAAGEEGVYVVDLLWNTEGRLITRQCYADLPSSVLDVCATKDRLYILCGEPDMEAVQFNEALTAHKDR